MMAARHPIVRISALLLIVVAMLGGACRASDNNDDAPRQAVEPALPTSTRPEGPQEFQRSDGKSLTITEPVKRIVSLSPGATEIIYAIGAEDALIAVDNQADYPAAANSFPTKLDAYEPNVEAIAALTPDLVVVASDIGGLVAALDGLNIPVLFIDLNTDVLRIDQVIGQIGMYGRITGKNAAAEALVAQLNGRVDAVRQTIAPLSLAPSVYHELDSTYFTAAEGSFIGHLYAQLNASNIAGDGGGSPYPQLTQEAIIASNPQIIVLADEEFGVTVESVKARPGWDAIDAVKNDRIYAIDPDIISRPGPRIVDALEQLAKLFYPEEFE